MQECLSQAGLVVNSNTDCLILCCCLVVGSILMRTYFLHIFFISLLGQVRGFRGLSLGLRLVV